MKVPPCDPDHALAQYELLRRAVTAGSGSGLLGPGRVVLQSRGLPAWLSALTALSPARVRPAPAVLHPTEGPRLLPPVRAELTVVVAGLVLACTRP
jgi:hypothetical protein